MHERNRFTLAAQWFEKSKLDLLEANWKLAIRVSDLKKEVANQEKYKLDLLLELNDTKNQSASKNC